MALLDAILNRIFAVLKPPVEPPRLVYDRERATWHERYRGYVGPLRWWDKLGPETFRCRACGHETMTWRGMQSHCREFGHRRPTAR